MSRATNKLLAILLSLSLGMAPLQGAFAALAATVGQQGVAGETATMVGCEDRMGAAQQSPQAACPDCVSQHESNSGGHCPSGGHCAGCLSAVLLNTLIPVDNHVAGSHWQAADVAVTSFSTSPLYRPPRG